MILEDYIDINARLYPDKQAIVCDHDTCTYEGLKNRIKEKMILLEKVSYRKGHADNKPVIHCVSGREDLLSISKTIRPRIYHIYTDPFLGAGLIRTLRT